MSNFSADSSVVSSQPADALEPLVQQLQSDSSKLQLAAVNQLAAAGEAGILPLIEFLRTRQADVPQAAAGRAYQWLYQSSSPIARTFLDSERPFGIVPLRSAHAIDYQELQQLLIQQAYEMADRLTLQKLCELAGPEAVKRKWVYFSEVDGFPIEDVQTIDRLWRVYSEDRFGFSRQREIWLSVGQNWDRLWEKLAWKTGNSWTRYPNEFIWDVSAPPGHLPLSNQLRGVRMMQSLLAHPAWEQA
jgi:hypothetical protein